VFEYTPGILAPPLVPNPAQDPDTDGVVDWMVSTISSLTGLEATSLLRATWNTASYHSISAFGAMSSASLQFEYYDTYEYLTNHSLTANGLSIASVKTKNLAKFYSVPLPERHLYLQDISVRQIADTDMYVGYHVDDPNHHDYNNASYHWQTTPSSYDDYVLGTNHANNKAISFPVSLKNKATNISMEPLMFVPVIVYLQGNPGPETFRWQIYKDDVTLLGVNNTSGESNLFRIPQSLAQKSQTGFDAFTQGHKDRFQFTFEDGHIFASNRRAVDFPATLGVFDLHPLSVSPKKVKIRMNVFSNYDNTWKMYYIGQWNGGNNNGKDYAFTSTYQVDAPENTSHDQDWTSDSMTTWDLSMLSVNSPFDSSQPETQFTYHIYNNDNNTSLGTNFSTSFYDQFQIVVDSVVTSSLFHGYIKYCHPNGTSYFLSLVDGSGVDPDTNLQIGAYTQVKWIPQTSTTLPNTTQAK
jgi:hypothetical protein